MQVADHTQARKTLEVELEDMKKVVAKKKHALSEKESQMTHLQGLYDQREAELTDCRKELSWVEALVVELQEEMTHKSATWDTEKLVLEKACIDVYEDGFFKAIKQALSLAPETDPTRFDIAQDDDQPENDPASAPST